MKIDPICLRAILGVISYLFNTVMHIFEILKDIMRKSIPECDKLALLEYC